jgi:cell division ATPase FtsA
MMRGTVEAASQVLGIPVRRGVPHPDLIQAEEQWLSPVYSTALGLLQYSMAPRWGGVNSRVVSRKRPLWMRKFATAIEELF